MLRYQFEPSFNLKLSDKCCEYLKERPTKDWERKNNKQCAILGLMAVEGGRRSLNGKCIAFQNNKPIHFSPLMKVTNEWQEWFIKEYNIKLCKLYYEPYNFKRTGCKGCPFALKLAEQLEVMSRLLPNERKQCEIIWKPIYAEYRRLGYRLTEEENIKLF